jgi:hypothetical protein
MAERQAACMAKGTINSRCFIKYVGRCDVKSHLKKRKIKGIVIAAGIGVAAAMIFMAISIYFGYCTAYSIHTNSMNVSVFGLDIYRLIRVGEKYSGYSIGPNMGILCVIFVAVSLCIEQVIVRLLTKR